MGVRRSSTTLTQRVRATLTDTPESTIAAIEPCTTATTPTTPAAPTQRRQSAPEPGSDSRRNSSACRVAKRLPCSANTQISGTIASYPGPAATWTTHGARTAQAAVAPAPTATVASTFAVRSRGVDAAAIRGKRT
ncbi:hypothetical protein N867_13630 [Actinotalea fermentans ATCC 43279 = JCM 9966 = DSM 3133]|nr:hypothetical protein N867_13630 [Actinotalea fermentans ATCC 43279 = JCM 9966 = DSM 3133]